MLGFQVLLPLDGEGAREAGGRGETRSVESSLVTHSTIAAQWSPSPIKGEDKCCPETAS